MRERLFCALSLSLLLFFPAGCGEKIEPGTTSQKPAVVSNAALETATLTEHPVLYEAVGTVQAGATIHLDAKLVGAVESVKVREGDRVKTGDVLLVIDPSQVEAGFRQAEATLTEARKALEAAKSSRDAALASEELARATYERYLSLKKEDSVSAQEFDEVEARYRQAKAAVSQVEAAVQTVTARIKQVEAGLASASLTRKDAVITAPSDGVITAKLVEVGDLASPGKPLLSMDTVHGYRVDAILPETYIAEVKLGHRVMMTVPALGKDPVQGTIQTIVPAADQRTRSFLVKVTLPEGLSPKSGMFARVHIPLGRTRKLLIPSKAVMVQGQLTGLFLVDAQGIARFRLIRLGRSYPEGVEVLSGLAEGDRFVSQPGPKLTDGARVEVKP